MGWTLKWTLKRAFKVYPLFLKFVLLRSSGKGPLKGPLKGHLRVHLRVHLGRFLTSMMNLNDE